MTGVSVVVVAPGKFCSIRLVISGDGVPLFAVSTSDRLLEGRRGILALGWVGLQPFWFVCVWSFVTTSKTNEE